MKRFIKTTGALFKKDLKDALRNINMGIMLLLPPFFAAIFRFVSVVNLPGNYVLMLTTIMALTMIPLNYLATLIAEEKEKHTLRTLMLSGVSAAEFITSKILVTLLLLEVVNLTVFLLSGGAPAQLPMYLLITTLGAISLLMLGAAIGILSRDQMSTSVLSVPIMMLLLLPSTMQAMNPALGRIAEFTPVEHTMRLFLMWSEGQSIFTADGLKGLAVIAVWTVLGFLAYYLAYRKNRLDA